MQLLKNCRDEICLIFRHVKGNIILRELNIKLMISDGIYSTLQDKRIVIKIILLNSKILQLNQRIRFFITFFPKYNTLHIFYHQIRG